MNYLNSISRLGVRYGPLAVLLAALAALYLPWTWSEQLASLGGDSAVYVLSARHYAPMLPPDAVAAALEAESQFPPLYPLLLALGGGASDLRLAHALTTLCLVAAFAATYALARRIGLGRAMALCTVALFALMPGTLEQALQLKSEALYAALSLGSLAVLARREPGVGTHAGWVAAGLVSLALLTRSAGVALLPALLLVLWRRRPPRWGLMAVLAVGPALAWALTRDTQASYGGTLAAYAQAPLPEILGRFGAHAVAIMLGASHNVTTAPALGWVLVPLAIVAAVVLAGRLRQAQPDAVYVAAYLAMLVAWPYPSEAQRLAWVVMPVLLAYVLGAAQAASAALPEAMAVARGVARAGVPLWLALAIVPAFGSALLRWAEAASGPHRALAHLPEWYGRDPGQSRELAQRHLDLAQAVADLGARVPPHDCIYAIKAATVTYYARRHTYAPPPEAMPDDRAAAWLRDGGCRHFLLLAATDGQHFATPFYPGQRLAGRLEVLAERAGTGSDAVIAALARLKP